MAFNSLTVTERSFLRLQRMVGWATFAVVGPGSMFTMRVLNRNRLEGLDEARRIFKQALASGRPTLICANHLTMVDSAYLHWGFAPLWEYLLHYERFSWNVAAVEHLLRNPGLGLMCFLGKTVPIDRAGDEAQRKRVLDKIRWLLRRGELCTLFPEGTRSRTGRIDPASVTYGVGQILKDLERPQVLCVYLRGDHQEGAASKPAYGDTMRIEVELLEPTTQEQGLRATRDLSRQVIGKLKAMEDAYLARRGTGFVVKA